MRSQELAKVLSPIFGLILVSGAFLFLLAAQRDLEFAPITSSSIDFIGYHSVGDRQFPGTYVLKFKGRSKEPTRIDFSVLIPEDLTAGDLEIACPEISGSSTASPDQRRLSYTGTAPGSGTYLLKTSFRSGHSATVSKKLPTVLVCVSNPK